MDEAEDKLDLPRTINDAEEHLQICEQVLDNAEYKISDIEKKQAYGLMQELQDAIKGGDKRLIQAKTDELFSCWWQIVIGQPPWWVKRFYYLESRVPDMSNVELAQQYVDQGYRGHLRILGFDITQSKKL